MNKVLDAFIRDGVHKFGVIVRNPDVIDEQTNVKTLEGGFNAVGGEGGGDGGVVEGLYYSVRWEYGKGMKKKKDSLGGGLQKRI